MIAADLLDRGDRLVAKEAIRIVERGDQRVHRPLRAELAPASPECDGGSRRARADREAHGPSADDRPAVAHERLARRAFQRAMTEQREQSGNEQAIRGPHFPGAADRFWTTRGSWS